MTLPVSGWRLDLVLHNGKRTLSKECIRRGQGGKRAIITEDIAKASHLSGRLDIFRIHLLKLLDVLQDCRELPRICFHFLVGKSKSCELCNMPDLCGIEHYHVEVRIEFP